MTGGGEGVALKGTEQPLGCLTGARSAGARAGQRPLVSGMRGAGPRSPSPSLCLGPRLLLGPINLARAPGSTPARPPERDPHLAIQTESHKDARTLWPRGLPPGDLLRGKHGTVWRCVHLGSPWGSVVEREPMSHGLRENAEPSGHQGSVTVLSPDPWECTGGPGVGLLVTFFNYPLINLKSFCNKSQRSEQISRDLETAGACVPGSSGKAQFLSLAMDKVELLQQCGLVPNPGWRREDGLVTLGGVGGDEWSTAAILGAHTRF